MARQAQIDMLDRKVEVNRLKLVDQLKENLEKHRIEYLEAVEGYREQALKQLGEAGEKAKHSLERTIVSAKASIEKFDPRLDISGGTIVLVERVVLNLPVPKDYSSEYETAIAMAEWDTRETLELTTAEFQCFVRDVWDWSSNFKEVHMSYTRAM